MSTADEQLQIKIEALRKSFVAGLAGRFSELDAALAKIRDERPLAEQAEFIGVILEHAHKIAGSAGTFGFDRMSIVASEIEQLCDSIVRNEHGADVDARGRLSEGIAALHAEVPR